MNLSIINMSARKNSFAFQNLHTPAKKLENFGCWVMMRAKSQYNKAVVGETT